MSLNKYHNNNDINNLPKDTQNNYYYTLKSYIDIFYDSLFHNDENNIYKYKCIISSYLSDLKFMYNLNSINKFIINYKPMDYKYSILDILKKIHNKKIKLLFIDIINSYKTKRRRSKINKRKTRK